LAGPCAPPADADADECLGEYRHLFSADILAGQVAFITGGGSGIGFRIAEIFMRHGCHTVIASRSLERVLQVSPWRDPCTVPGWAKQLCPRVREDYRAAWADEGNESSTRAPEGAAWWLAHAGHIPSSTGGGAEVEC
uniref:Peroxisomal 2,4-dienoyl-CoA reductase [(3E)-enoyl-CoA-producing] n=1 Tax=Nothoprocta perdicaria TaxID=30464 RepID=A0A8C6ZQ52_NOTPE